MHNTLAFNTAISHWQWPRNKWTASFHVPMLDCMGRTEVENWLPTVSVLRY